MNEWKNIHNSGILLMLAEVIDGPNKTLKQDTVTLNHKINQSDCCDF